MPILSRLDQYASILSGEFDEVTNTSISLSGLGTFYSSEFLENVGVALTLTANVFPPYNIIYDEFGMPLYGPGQGIFMRQNTDSTVVIYNEIDEITGII